MNSPIMPVDGPSDLPSFTPSATSGDVAAFVAALAVGESALAIEAARGGPPPEVLDQIATAGRIEETLRASGQQLRFSCAAPGERTRIEVDERGGDAVRTLSVAEALDIATGKPSR